MGGERRARQRAEGEASERAREGKRRRWREGEGERDRQQDSARAKTALVGRELRRLSQLPLLAAGGRPTWRTFLGPAPYVTPATQHNFARTDTSHMQFYLCWESSQQHLSTVE